MATTWTRATLLDPASDWVADGTKDKVVCWHGCTSLDLASIVTKIDMSKCRVDTDFGQGFYTTGLRRQARHWAWIRYFDLPLPTRKVERPVILRFELLRVELARLESMSFVSGRFDNDEYWSLVQHCRLSPPPPNHNRHEHPGRVSRWYDLAIGPVADFWYQRTAIPDFEQMSFHTLAAVQVLEDYIAQQGGNKGWIEDVV